MMRAGLYRPVHVKTLRSQKLRMLLTHRRILAAWSDAAMASMVLLMRFITTCCN